MFRVALLFIAAAAATDIDVYSRDDLDASGLNYTCFRIPALLRTRNGSLVTFAEGRRGSCDDHGDVRLLQRISNDDGVTWSHITQVKQEDGHTIGNPAPITDLATGAIHLLYSRDNRQVFVTKSVDGGASWGDSSELTGVVTDVPVPFIGTGPTGGIQLPGGRLISAMYYNCPGEGTDDCPQGQTRSLTIYSDDHGATWKRGSNVQPGNRTHNIVYGGGESQVATFGTNGDLAMLSRVRGDFPSANAVDHNHAIAISKDGGATWSNDTLLHIESTFCQGSIVGTPSGTVLISAPSTPNGVRANLTVWASLTDTSGELYFEYHATVYRGSSAYSSLMPSLSEGTYLNLFEREGSGFITLHTFNYPAEAGSLFMV